MSWFYLVRLNQKNKSAVIWFPFLLRMMSAFIIRKKGKITRLTTSCLASRHKPPYEIRDYVRLCLKANRSTTLLKGNMNQQKTYVQVSTLYELHHVLSAILNASLCTTKLCARDNLKTSPFSGWR